MNPMGFPKAIKGHVRLECIPSSTMSLVDSDCGCTLKYSSRLWTCTLKYLTESLISLGFVQLDNQSSNTLPGISPKRLITILHLF